MGVGDGLDDRETETETAAVGTPMGLRAEALEGPEQAPKFAGWDDRAGAGDG